MFTPHGFVCRHWRTFGLRPCCFTAPSFRRYEWRARGCALDLLYRLRTEGVEKARFFLAVRQVNAVRATFWRSSGGIAAGFMLAMAQRGSGQPAGQRALDGHRAGAGGQCGRGGGAGAVHLGDQVAAAALRGERVRRRRSVGQTEAHSASFLLWLVDGRAVPHPRGSISDQGGL